MATIRHKRSTTAGAVPAGGALAEGEIAVNVADGRLFVKRSNGSVTNVTADGHTHALSALTGVSLSSPTSGQVLKYDGSNWVNGTDNAGSGGSTASNVGASGTGVYYAASGNELQFRKLAAGTGVSITAANPDTGTLTVAVGSDVVRTAGDQNIAGQKTFTDRPLFSGGSGTVDGSLRAAFGLAVGASNVSEQSINFVVPDAATFGGRIKFGLNASGVAQANALGVIENLATPSSANHAANKAYVDSQVATKANTSHTHAASEINSGTLAIARIPTGSDANSVCIGNDSRLSDARTPTSHTHGNITNAGAIGSTSGVPIITGTSGVLQAGSFGSTAGTFCQGNDSRLSDARTPTSHTHGNITNAGAIGSTSGVPIITGASGVLQAGSFGTAAGSFCQGNDARLSDARTPTSHVHGNITNAGAIGSTSGVPIITGASGVLQAGSFGTSAGQFAEGNHNHALSSLTGVSISSPSSGQVLKFNGTNWINDTDATGGGGSVTAEDDQIILAMRVFA